MAPAQEPDCISFAAPDFFTRPSLSWLPANFHREEVVAKQFYKRGRVRVVAVDENDGLSRAGLVSNVISDLSKWDQITVIQKSFFLRLFRVFSGCPADPCAVMQFLWDRYRPLRSLA